MPVGARTNTGGSGSPRKKKHYRRCTFGGVYPAKLAKGVPRADNIELGEGWGVGWFNDLFCAQRGAVLSCDSKGEIASDILFSGGGAGGIDERYVELEEMSGARQVALGYGHICGLFDSEPNLRCMGANSNGQLGDGQENHPLPAIPVRRVL